jgi:tetratricopeptide (TPR) repeat protein
MICQQCQMPLNEGAKFCSECAAPVPQPVVASVCQQCQTVLPEGAKFCSECATPVPEPQAPPVSFEGVANRSAIQQIGTINVGGMTEGQYGEITRQLSQLLDRVGVSANVPLTEHPTPASPEAQEVAQAVSEKVREAEERFQHPVGDPQVHFQLGDVAYGNQEYQEAIEHYDKAIQIDPHYADAYNNRGLAYHNLGENQRAIQDYDKAIQLDPNFAMAYGNRGYTYQLLGEHRRAIQDLDKAIQLDPDDALASHALVYHNREWNYSALGENQRAIEDYDKVIQLDPNNAMAYGNRGYDYYNLGENQRAIEDYDKAIQLDPDDALHYSNRGNAYQALAKASSWMTIGKWKWSSKALEDWDKARSLGNG